MLRNITFDYQLVSCYIIFIRLKFIEVAYVHIKILFFNEHRKDIHGRDDGRKERKNNLKRNKKKNLTRSKKANTII